MNHKNLPTLSEEKITAFLRDPNLDDKTHQLIKNSLSKNTLRAYTADLKIFQHWCNQNHQAPFPATPQTIANFLAHQSQLDPAPKSVTLSRRLAAIRYLHKLANLDHLPTDHTLVRQTLKGIMRQNPVAPNQKKPSTHDIMHRIIAQIDTTTLLGLRDRALLLTGFAGAFRRSELVNIRLEHLNFHDKGVDIFIPYSKTDQAGHGITKPIIKGKKHCPATTLQQWISQAGIESGYLFRAVSRGGNVKKSSPQQPLDDKTVARVLKKHISKLGLSSEHYAGHSLRSGFVTAALHQGASYEKIMEVTGQKDIKTLIRYYRHIAHYDNHAGDGLL